jgi:hypothetical protein
VKHNIIEILDWCEKNERFWGAIGIWRKRDKRGGIGVE